MLAGERAITRIPAPSPLRRRDGSAPPLTWSTIAAMTSNRTLARAAATAVPLLLLLAACGGGGSDAEGTTTTAAKATTTTAAKEAEDEATTTTEATEVEVSDEAPTEGLPTDEDVAPSGSWIGVRFLAASDPEPDDFAPGYAEARLYDITPDCDDDGCTLELAGGGEDGSFAMPDVERLPGEPLVLTPDGDSWTFEEVSEPYGCTDELDGPYLTQTETRDLEPVWDDEGVVTGLVGTTLYEYELTAEGRDAGCPASVEGADGYATVVAPNDGIMDLEEYEVDGTYRQTIEVTASTGYTDESYLPGGANVTLEGHDVELSGGCSDGECEVDLSQINGQDAERETTLYSEDGLALVGAYDEVNGCRSDDDGSMVFETGAYEATGAYEDLIPVWVEDGQVIAFVGRFTYVATPTELGETDPSCDYEQTEQGWAYLVDTSIFEGT